MVDKTQAEARSKHASAGLAEAQTASAVVEAGMNAIQANAIAEQMMMGPGAMPAQPPAGQMPPPGARPPQPMQPQMPAQGMQ